MITVRRLSGVEDRLNIIAAAPLLQCVPLQPGDEVEVGCGSVLNPGTVIGKNTNIYPLSSVRGVVPANSIYKKQGEVAEKR